LKEAGLLVDKANQDAWQHAQDVDAMVFKTAVPPAAYSISRARGVPGFEVGLWPFEPTRELPSMVVGGGVPRSALYNRITSNITYQLIWRITGPTANRFRREILNMPPLPVTGPLAEYRRVHQPSFYAFSPTVLPKPADWREDAHIVGYMFLDEAREWTPPADLVRFIQGGTKPVYIGFGSMTGTNSRQKVETILAALAHTGQRAILLGGWGSLGADLVLPETVYLADNVPHAWLFPQMAAVMHHGGAGTTAAGLRSGAPSIVVPHNFDQPFWGNRVHLLGAGPRPIPLKEFTVERVAAAIHEATHNTSMQHRAADVAARIRAENGVECALDLFEQYIEKHTTKSVVYRASVEKFATSV
jgi:sterol 3beta-glucosyltransferase